MQEFELYDGEENRGVFKGPLPRPGESITFMKGDGGFSLTVVSIEHFCHFEAKTSTARVYARQTG